MTESETKYPSGYASHQAINDWLTAMMVNYTLVAPQEISGIVAYHLLQGLHQIAWDSPRPSMSVKEFFLPATEQLLEIDKKGQQVRLTETIFNQHQVLLGVRPCDARGLRALDAVFISTSPIDQYYARRRRATTIVGLSCTHMGESCFCTSVGGAPDDPSDMDIMLTPTEGGYLVQIVTEKGQSLSANLHLLPPPAELSYPQPIQAQPFSLPDINAWPSHFTDAYWEEMAERCLSCRICAYVCPTCRCFDVRDEVLSCEDGWQRFERIRCWDSCAGEAYRRIAGGHNPRATKGERLRNRFFCKFYYFAHQYGPGACTGCGRCIDACPVNIDITEVLQHLAEVC